MKGKYCIFSYFRDARRLILDLGNFTVNSEKNKSEFDPKQVCINLFVCMFFTAKENPF